MIEEGVADWSKEWIAEDLEDWGKKWMMEGERSELGRVCKIGWTREGVVEDWGGEWSVEGDEDLDKDWTGKSV